MKENQDLNPYLIERIAHLKSVPKRDEKAAAQGRAKFLAQAAALRPRQAARKQILFSKRLAWQFALASLAVIVFIFGGSAGVAVAARDDLPGQFLYPVKLLTEDIRLDLAVGTHAKIDLLLGFVDVRIVEINQLALQDSEIPAQTTERLENQVQFMLQLAAGLENDEELHVSLMRIEAQLQEQILNLAMVSGEAGETLFQIQVMLQARLRLVDEGLLNQQTFRNQMRYGQDDSLESRNPGRSDFDTGNDQNGIPDSGNPDQTPGSDHEPQKTPDPHGTPSPGGGGYGQGMGPFGVSP